MTLAGGLGEAGCSIVVEHLADAAVVRSLILRLGRAFGLDSVRASEAALVASELSTNMVKYAGRGTVHVEQASGDDTFWIVASDRGPGLPPEEEFFRDRMGRGAALGPDDPQRLGLGCGGGAIRRFSSETQVLARPGGGTQVRCRFSISPPGRQGTK